MLKWYIGTFSLVPKRCLDDVINFPWTNAMCVKRNKNEAFHKADSLQEEKKGRTENKPAKTLLMCELHMLKPSPAQNVIIGDLT